jgi:pyrimidine operon attenuation protein/uracil phosphoribosyltransferase
MATSEKRAGKSILDASGVKRALARMAHEVAERNENGHDVALAGVQTGGAVLARRLANALAGIWGHPVPVGLLDVGMHRDDHGRGAQVLVHPTTLPFDVNGKIVILVDDVLFSGRTTRAALDALHDFGRPRAVQLAVMIDRGHRQLPIKADFVGKTVATSANERIVVHLGAGDDGSDAVTLEKP